MKLPQHAYDWLKTLDVDPHSLEVHVQLANGLQRWFPALRKQHPNLAKLDDNLLTAVIVCGLPSHYDTPARKRYIQTHWKDKSTKRKEIIRTLLGALSPTDKPTELASILSAGVQWLRQQGHTGQSGIRAAMTTWIDPVAPVESDDLISDLFG